MYQKRNKFLTFIFALLPGAAEMYMGFMKMGLTLLSLFWSIVAAASWLGLEFLVYVALIVWIFSFFHAINLASLPDEKFAQIEDDYLIHLNSIGVKTSDRKIRRVVAAVLIFIGIVLCYNAVCGIISCIYPENWISYMLQIINTQATQAICGIVVIVVGISMIRGKKRDLDEEAQKDGNNGIDEK